MNMYDGGITISEMQPRDLQNLIQTGEGDFLEFKRTTPSVEKIAREIAAFANTRGGTILVGVDDNKTITGIQGYFEEEYLLMKAASEFCIPAIPITIELVHFMELDVMVIRVPEVEAKPVYNKNRKGRQVFVRRADESVLASDEMVKILKNKTSEKGVTFEYGENEQRLFRFLNEYGEITVQKYAHLINVTTYRASKILVNLVSAGILSLSNRDNVEYFMFSERTEK
ncbi:MAG: ATP-binding protein [Balneolaceae bacterium]